MIGKIATTVATQEGVTTVTYHETAVVAFDDKTVKLDTGGWFTSTTKKRMNQTSEQFGLGYRVFQKRGKWFGSYNGNDYPFDGALLRLER